MNDLTLYETGQGGDIQLLGNDLSTTSSVFNIIYMALFGGSVDAETIGNEVDSELRVDWWGNGLLFGNEQEIQFNSITEKTLNETALNSEGRIIIEEAVKKDLSFLTTFAEVEVEVIIPQDDKVSIAIKVNEPSNVTEKEFQFIWDSTRNEIIESKTI